MKEIFEYNGRKIQLDYSENYIERIKHPFKVWSLARGVLRKYDKIEEKALARLISKPLGRRKGCNLVAIKGIKRSVQNFRSDGEMGLELRLEGYAIFKRLD